METPAKKRKSGENPLADVHAAAWEHASQVASGGIGFGSLKEFLKYKAYLQDAMEDDGPEDEQQCFSQLQEQAQAEAKRLKAKPGKKELEKAAQQGGMYCELCEALDRGHTPAAYTLAVMLDITLQHRWN